MRKTAVLCAVVLAFCSMAVCAAFNPREDLKPFKIEGVGTAFIPGEIDCTAAVGTEMMKSIETQYDLISYEADSSHYARLIVYKGSHNLGPALALVDMVEFKPEFVTLLSNYGQNLVSKKLEENGGSCIDWLPAQKVKVQKHNGVQFGARATLSKKLPIPMYATVAVFPTGGKITGIALICPDSDRIYWQPVFGEILHDITED